MFCILRYLHRIDSFCSRFSGTCSDSTFFCIGFFDTRPNRSPFVYVVPRHHTRILYSICFRFLALCPNSSIPPLTSCLDLFFSTGIVSESYYLLENHVRILLSPLPSHPDPISSLRRNVRIPYLLRHRVWIH